MTNGLRFSFYDKHAHKNEQENSRIILRYKAYDVPENKNGTKS